MGRKPNPDRETIPRGFYGKIPKDENGWVDVTKHLPYPYDLTIIKTDDFETHIAWHNGKRWDGNRISRDLKVIAWKRKMFKGE